MDGTWEATRGEESREERERERVVPLMLSGPQYWNRVWKLALSVDLPKWLAP